MDGTNTTGLGRRPIALQRVRVVVLHVLVVVVEHSAEDALQVLHYASRHPLSLTRQVVVQHDHRLARRLVRARLHVLLRLTHSSRPHDDAPRREQQFHAEALGIGNVVRLVLVHAQQDVAQVVVLADLVQRLPALLRNGGLPVGADGVAQHVENAVDVTLGGEVHARVDGLVARLAVLAVAHVRLVAAHLL